MAPHNMSSSGHHGWYITEENEPEPDKNHYDEFEELFTIKLHHGGMFTEMPRRAYIEGEVHYIHCVHRDEFNENFLLEKILNPLGYDYYSHWWFHYMLPGGNLDHNLYPLADHYNYMGFLEKLEKHRMICVYVSFSVVNLYIQPRTDERMADRMRQIYRGFAETANMSP